MTKGTAIFLLGILLLIIPAFGIPLFWKQILYGTVGVVLIGMGYSLRRAQYLSTLANDGDVRTADTFVETTTPLFDATR